MPRALDSSVLGRVVDYISRIGELHGWALFAHCCLLVWVIWLPAFAVEWIATQIFTGRSGANPFDTPLKALVGATLIAPLSETLGMRWLFGLLRKYWQNPIILSAVSALAWVPLHWTYAGWGVHAAWPFFVLGICYLRLEVISWKRAFWLTATLHGGVNALGYVHYLLFELHPQG